MLERATLENEEILVVYGLDLVRECKLCSRARTCNDQLRVEEMVNDVDIFVTIYFVSCSIFIENEN